MTASDGSNATAPHARVALIKSIVNHATDDTTALDEVRAVLAGAGIEDLLRMRGA